MKTFLPTKPNQGLTLIELLVVIVIVGILAVLVYPGGTMDKARALRVQCINNLKQTGLAYRVWEGDHGDNYPMTVSETKGGSMEFVTGQNAFRHFQVMSNELYTPLLLFCPAETDQNRFRATNWNISNSNITYFVGVDASETNATMILGGDHNLTNGTPVRDGILQLTTNKPVGWTSEMHNKVGNVLLADGSVQQLSIGGLRATVANTGVLTNRLQMPILGP